ncbi:MAG: hypothetical protein RLP15_02660 [Cryomorphaceae bacterium]
MKRVIRLRVLMDHDDVIFRDLEVACSGTFSELHELIQEAFGFDNSQMASFYVSNEDWEKGQEITLMDMGEKNENGEPILLMHDTPLKDVIFESGQKLIYVFDFFLMWCFYVDVVDMKELDSTVITPRIAQSFGEAPEQYSKSPEMNFEAEDASSSFDEEDEDIEDVFDMLSINEDYADDREY